MTTNRLEAFSDGVIAIAITIMVLELKAPEGHSLQSLRPLVHTLGAYIFSFIYVGIYWNNHHHMLHATESVNGRVLWANLHLLFWVSLMPFTTAWVGETNLASLPSAVYGIVLLGAAIAFVVLEREIIAHEGSESCLKRALGATRKETISVALYVLGIGMAWVNTWISAACYAVVAAMWFTPDPRIERKFNAPERKPEISG